MTDQTLFCSDGWAGLPALGTAADASFWVCFEQDGPWGKKAFAQSRLDPTLGTGFHDLVRDAGGRALLVRRPSSHAERPDARHRVWVGGGPGHAPWLASGELDDVAQLVSLLAGHPGGPQALASDATPPDWLQPCAPILLVCTNGKRDLCCATKGGPLARELEARFPGRIWEATHLGGHRFATTTLSLPSRQMLARVDAALAERALSPRPLPVGEQHDRGLTHLDGALGAADAWLRAATGETDTARLGYEVVDDQTIAASHLDGRSWLLRVHQLVDEAAARPSSCGVAAVPLKLWQVEAL